MEPAAAGAVRAVNCAAVVETLLEAELFGIEERTATGVRGRRGVRAGRWRHAVPRRGRRPVAHGAGRLLRALQDLSIERVGGSGVRRVNTRIVAATNQPLSALVENGAFRADLYYRLSGVEIHVGTFYGRDARDRLETITYSIGRTIEYAFDSEHRITRGVRFQQARRGAELCQRLSVPSVRRRPAP